MNTKTDKPNIIPDNEGGYFSVITSREQVNELRIVSGLAPFTEEEWNRLGE